MLNNIQPHYINSHDGTKLYFAINKSRVDISKTTPLFFNYGLVCNNAHWQEQIKYFDEQGYPIIIHDFRGHFNSSPNIDVEKVTFDNIVEDMKCILAELKVNEVHLLGHSMGVNICLEFTRRWPEMVKSQILVAGSVMPPQDVMFNNQGMNIVFPLIKKLEQTIPDIYNFLWKTGGLNPLAQYWVHTGGFNAKEVSREFIQVYVNRIGKLNPKIFIKLLEEMRDHNILNKLESMDTHALVIGGDKDKVIPLPIQRLMFDRLPNAEWYMVKEGSHVPQVDFPEHVNERIEFFLNN